MKYLAAAALLAFTPAMLPALTSAANAVEMPKELRGIWCSKEYMAQKTIYRRCRVANGEDVVAVGAYKFSMAEATFCTPPLAITSYSGGYFVRARCYNTDASAFISKDTPSSVVLQQWRLFKNGRRLEIRVLEETNGK
jgi:hypothetical protein